MGAELAGLLARAAALRPADRSPALGLCVPGMVVYEGKRGRFPALSITGQSCALGCAHCRGQMLRGMGQADEPERLVARAEAAWQSDCGGILISGGCDQGGRLPWERFAPAIAEIKRRTGLFVAVHAGFPDAAQARLLAKAGADLAMIDIIGDDETARQVYGLPGAKATADSLAALADAGLKTAPHIVAGLHFGQFKGEYEALEAALSHEPGWLVVVVLRPLGGTPMAGVAPPSPEDVARLLATARIARPELILNLGCGRPRGPHAARLDNLAVKAGIDNIAVPAPETAALAAAAGRTPVWHHACCTAPRPCGGPGDTS